MQPLGLLATLALTLGAAACGDDAGDKPTDTTAADDGGAPPTERANGGDSGVEADDRDAAGGPVEVVATDPAAPSVGGFTIRIVEPVDATDTPGFTSITGKVYDVPVPARLVWEEAAEEGECMLEVPRVPVCDPDCGADVCIEDGVCTPNAVGLNAGPVTLSGLRTMAGEETVELDPLIPLNSYQLAQTLPYQPFDEGDAIRMEASGADLPPFAAESVGIVPIELQGPDEIPVTPGESLPLRWLAGGEPAARIRVEIDISHHGGTRGIIRCDAEDDGELDVPADLVTGLIDLGVSGFPVVNLTRHADGDTMVGEYRVVLSVMSGAQRGLLLPGIISCLDDSVCPDGQTCLFDMRCG